MYKVGDFVVYKRDVCKVKEIKQINDEQYYVLVPIDDDSLTINVPLDNSPKLIRVIISKKESEDLIRSIPSIPIISANDKLIENEYKKLLSSGDLKDLVKIIKTTYLRNEDRLSNHKKIGEKDDNYFKKAEKLLYNELSISLEISYDDTKKYIKETVETLIKWKIMKY